MFKRVFSTIGFILIAALTLALAGCSTTSASTTPADIKADLGQQFTLPVGKTVVINGENLSLKFTEVTTDSRCPKGVQCVWAGEAKCQLQVTQSGKSPATSNLTLTETGGNSGFSQATLDNYKIEFQLTPYPESGKTIAAGDYQLTLKITK